MIANKFAVFVTAAFVFALDGPAHAEVKISGYFIARAECPAFRSFRKGTNPGEILTQPDHAYDMLAKNRDDATHYRIEIDTAEPKQRWVATSCGEHVVPVAGKRPAGPDGQYVLAISWQPGFCETRPNKPECRSQTAERFDASHFTLHGLWPQPRSKNYCHVSAENITLDKNRRWEELPELALETETRKELDTVMPGTRSFLHRHEWIKHGTCYNDEPAEDYYADSLALISVINASDVRNLMKNNVGQHVDTSALKAEFDAAFGAGAGERIRVICKNDGNRRLITEITIGLAGAIAETPNLGALMLAAPTTDPGCPGGIVDPVGLQ